MRIAFGLLLDFGVCGYRGFSHVVIGLGHSRVHQLSTHALPSGKEAREGT